MMTDGNTANIMFRPLRFAIATASAPWAFSKVMSNCVIALMTRSISTSGRALCREDWVLALSALLALVMVVVGLLSHKVRVLIFDTFERIQDGIADVL